MRKSRFASLAGLAALSLALVAAGCGGGGGKKGTTNSSGSGGNGTLRMSIGSEPPSLDPGLATDTTSAFVVFNTNVPIVYLGSAPDLQPEPALAQTWDVKGNNITLHLRHDVKWTNGDPVTAKDVVYSWLREVSPELGADYAYQFYGIVGAQDYNSCDPSKDNCDSLKSKVGITAP